MVLSRFRCANCSRTTTNTAQPTCSRFTTRASAQSLRTPGGMATSRGGNREPHRANQASRTPPRMAK